MPGEEVKEGRCEGGVEGQKGEEVRQVVWCGVVESVKQHINW